MSREVGIVPHGTSPLVSLIISRATSVPILFYGTPCRAYRPHHGYDASNSRMRNSFGGAASATTHLLWRTPDELSIRTSVRQATDSESPPRPMPHRGPAGPAATVFVSAITRCERLTVAGTCCPYCSTS